MTKYDACVFIGRFQPFHNGHLAVIKEGLKRSEKVIVLVGSANSAQNLHNPFSYPDRFNMIWDALVLEDRNRVYFEPLPDTKYNDDLWTYNVQKAVRNGINRAFGFWSNPKSIALIGHAKDHTSYYLKLFPQWDSVDIPGYVGKENVLISATDIRQSILSKDLNQDPYLQLGLNMYLPKNVKTFVDSWIKTDIGQSLCREHAFIQDYKKQWSVAPYAPTFVTVDAIVVQSGHILLVERAAEPGKGQWAMPGGFINQNEKLIDAVLRELKEETKIKVPVPVLRGNITKKEVFDDPNRSMRGRTITHAYLIQLPDDTILPKVKGSDDAAKAKWWPLSEVTCEMMYEDHWHIIQSMIGGL